MNSIVRYILMFVLAIATLTACGPVPQDTPQAIPSSHYKEALLKLMKHKIVVQETNVTAIAAGGILMLQPAKLSDITSAIGSFEHEGWNYYILP